MQPGSGLPWSPSTDVRALLDWLGDPSQVLLDLDGVKARFLRHALVVGTLQYGRVRVLLTESALHVAFGWARVEAITWTDPAIRRSFLWTVREIRKDHETLWIRSRWARHPAMRGNYRLRGPRVPELAAALEGLLPPEVARR